MGRVCHLGEYKSNVCLVTVLLETPGGIIILIDVLRPDSFSMLPLIKQARVYHHLVSYDSPLKACPWSGRSSDPFYEPGPSPSM